MNNKNKEKRSPITANLVNVVISKNKVKRQKRASNRVVQKAVGLSVEHNLDITNKG